MGQIISIVGTSGVGKTTLMHALAQTGSFNPAYEDHESRPFQHLFKQDTRYALANQVDYLLLRAEQEHELRCAPQIGLTDGGLDLDFFGFTRLFLTRGLLTQPEYDLCRRVYTFIRSTLPLPELIIRLNAPCETVAGRLSQRDRINIASADDFDLLETYLDEWLAVIEPQRTLNLDVSAHDPGYAKAAPILLKEIEARLGSHSRSV